jgi:hypothetical protein
MTSRPPRSRSSGSRQSWPRGPRPGRTRRGARRCCHPESHAESGHHEPDTGPAMPERSRPSVAIAPARSSAPPMVVMTAPRLTSVVRGCAAWAGPGSGTGGPIRWQSSRQPSPAIVGWPAVARRASAGRRPHEPKSRRPSRPRNITTDGRPRATAGRRREQLQHARRSRGTKPTAAAPPHEPRRVLAMLVRPTAAARHRPPSRRPDAPGPSGVRRSAQFLLIRGSTASFGIGSNGQ